MKTSRFLATTSISLVLTLPAFSVIETWDGGGADNNLSTALNWLDNTAPVSDLANTDLLFAGIVRLTPNVGTALSADSITFNSTAGAFAISGTTLTVGTGGITNSDADTQVFNNPINFGSVASSSVLAAGGLSFTSTVTLPTATLIVDGPGATSFRNFSGNKTLTKQGTGTMTWQPSIPNNPTLVVSAGTLVTGADGTPDTLGGSGSIAVNGTSTFTIGENLTLDSSKITRVNGASLALAAGKTLTLQDSGDVTLSGGFNQATAATINVTGSGSTFTMSGSSEFRGGSTLNITAGGSVSNTSFIDLASSGGNANVLVDGAGSSFSAGTTSFWGHNGNTAIVTFSNGGSGSFGGLTVTDGVAGSFGAINVLSGSSLTVGNLSLAESTAAATVSVTVLGAGSTVTQNTLGATLTIGAASSSSGTLHVQSGGTFNSNATGTVTVKATGTVAIEGGIFNANGNMTVGGQLTRDASGVFALAAGKTLTIQGGGDFVITGNHAHNTASTVTVTGAGSTLRTTSHPLRFAGGSTLNVLAGGQAVSADSLDFAVGSGNATVLVDGAGSLLASGSFGVGVGLVAGFGGSSATLTFSNGGAGSFGLPMLLSSSSAAGTNTAVNVLSGASVSAGGLTMANAAGPATATLSISGAGSQFLTTDSTPSTIGAASQSSAQVTITNGGTFTTSTAALNVEQTGSVTIDGGTFNANGNLTLNGGQLSRTATGNFNFAANKSLTIQNGGDATFTGDHIQLNPSNLSITGSGSTLTTTGDFQWEGNSNTLVFIQVNGGGQLASGGALHLARNDTAVALTANGAGSQITSAPGSTSEWQAGVLLVNGANASLGGLRIADVSFASSTSGSLHVQSSSTVSMGNLAVATAIASNIGEVEVSGVGSAITQIGASTLTLGTFVTSTATLTVADGGSFTSGTGNVTLNTTGTIDIDGGLLDLKGPLLRNGGTLNFNTGELRIVENLVVGTGGLLGTSLTLDHTRSFVTTAITTIDTVRKLTLNGGSFSTATLVNNGNFVFNSGTLAITGAGGFNIGTGALGASVALGSGANLKIANLTTIANGALLRVDGGGFSGADLVNDGTLDHRDGALNFTGTLTNNAAGRLFVGGLSSPSGAITNTGRITLQNGIGFLGGAGSITNTGLITGDGTIAKPLTNSTAGQLRAESGKTLTLTGTIAANVGTFSLQGGTLEFTSAIANSTTGFISGRGTLITNALTNSGVMAFSGGNTDVLGDVTNTTGARIVTSGAGSTTTFFDDVTHNGLEIFTGAGASTVFFGDQTGVGSFTGTGTVYFIGDLLPGASPASISFGGDLVLGTFARTVIEIGGTIPGTQHDRLSVADTLNLGGQLEIKLIDGFVPTAGQSFDVFDAASSTGNFSSIVLPALPPGLFWRTESLATQGVLYVGVVPATFGEFAAAYGLTQGATGDDDGDQVTNAMEFLLGSNPSDPSSLPYQSFTRIGQQSIYSFSLPELPPSAAKYAVKSSPDLQTWSTRATKSGLAPWTAGLAMAPPVNGRVIMTFEETDSAPRRFYRLGAELE